MNNKYFFKIIFVYTVFAFLLNFFWESWHSFSLYLGHSTDAFPVPKYVSLMTYVSFIDASIISAVFIGGCVLWKTRKWFVDMTRGKWFYFLGLLFVFAVGIEIKGVFIFEQWSYSMLMPAVFGMGLSPLLQLMVTGSLSLFVIKLFYQNY